MENMYINFLLTSTHHCLLYSSQSHNAGQGRNREHRRHGDRGGAVAELCRAVTLFGLVGDRDVVASLLVVVPRVLDRPAELLNNLLIVTSDCKNNKKNTKVRSCVAHELNPGRVTIMVT
jgi:hypothetical protein